MPHSPHIYQDKLWLLNSGAGYFGHVDTNSGKFVPVTFCPGYLRGLAFINNFAVVGLSKPRHSKTFSGLPLDQLLSTKDAEARCGLQVIDLRTGDIVEFMAESDFQRQYLSYAVEVLRIYFQNQAD